jgi:CubicO group peptidase (beta-lactamase class C family)
MYPLSRDIASFTQLLDSRLPHLLKAPHVPGAAVALIQRGQVVWVNCYGLADVQRRIPVTLLTIFQAASISKTVTAWGVMKLVERGQLELDAPAEAYLTRWHLPLSRFDPKGVTIRRLLSHSAGLAVTDYLGYPPGQALPSLEESLSNGPPTLGGLVRYTPGSSNKGGVHISMQPGEKYVYSDGDYVLLQLIVEEVTRETFAAFMQREILTPLGMVDSSFTRSPDLIARTALPYDVLGNPLPDFRFVELAPAGLYTTAPDLARFVASGLPDADGEPAGRGVISPASVELMYTPAVQIPGFDRWVYADAYGLGYFVETLPDGECLVSHMGGNLGWMCEFAALPSTADGIVIMTNSSAGHEVFADILTEWTRWLGQGEANVANSIHVARRLFQLLSFSMLVAAFILFARLVIDLGSGKGHIILARLPFHQALLAVIILIALALYWTVFNPMVQNDIPSQKSGMMLSVTSLCLAVSSNMVVLR